MKAEELDQQLRGQRLYAVEKNQPDFMNVRKEVKEKTGKIFKNGQAEVIKKFVDERVPVEKKGKAASLAGVDLRFADLHGINFVDADFKGADLTAANLKDTDFTDAKLDGCKVFKSDIARAKNFDTSKAEVLDDPPFRCV